ncbi:MAG: hypothetical protein GX833_01855 [Clostridium sp.]|nr:hypothetical protein [Clostridium sp.]
MKKKRSNMVLISMVLTAAYLIYSIVYWGKASSAGAESAEQVGAGLAMMLVFPHLLLTVFGFIFNLLAYFMRHRGFTLVSAIIYAVAILVFMPYFMFLMIQMILMFVAFAKLKPRLEVKPPVDSVESA